MALFLNPVPVSELAPNEPPTEWIWPGVLAKGFVTLLVGEWKAGKTTLLANLLARFGSGGMLAGKPVRPSTAAIITEESQSTWKERHARMNFYPRLMILSRPFFGRPSFEDWAELINTIALGERLPDLIVFDPISMFLPENTENHPASMVQALYAIHGIAHRGSAVLLIHHPGKRADKNHHGRGTGALNAFVDIDAKLLSDPAGRSSRVRRLVVKSRVFGNCTDEAIELSEDGRDYAAVPPGPSVGGWAEGITLVQAILRSAGEPLTAVDLWKAWHEDYPQPALKTLRHWLWMAHADGLLTRTGTGHRHDAFRYGVLNGKG